MEWASIFSSKSRLCYFSIAIVILLANFTGWQYFKKLNNQNKMLISRCTPNDQPTSSIEKRRPTDFPNYPFPGANRPAILMLAQDIFRAKGGTYNW